MVARERRTYMLYSYMEPWGVYLNHESGIPSEPSYSLYEVLSGVYRPIAA